MVFNSSQHCSGSSRSSGEGGLYDPTPGGGTTPSSCFYQQHLAQDLAHCMLKLSRCQLNTDDERGP